MWQTFAEPMRRNLYAKKTDSAEENVVSTTSAG